MKRILPLIIAAMIILAACTNNPQQESPTLTLTTSPGPSGTGGGAPADPSNINTLAKPGNIPTANIEPPEQKQADAYNAMADKLTAAMLTGGAPNEAITPISMYLALSMLAGGAEGQTADELYNLIGLDKAESTAFSKQLMEWFNSNNMRTVNSAWIQSGFPVEMEYVQTLSEDYYAWLNEVRFTDGSAGTLIAAWVKEQTKGMITPELDIDSNTVLSLVNATVLIDEWVNNFNPDATKQEDFHLADGSTKQVDMMHAELHQNQWLGDDFRTLQLPLKETGSMMFALPNEGVSPYDLIKEGGTGLTKLFNLDGNAEIDGALIEISIPKFDIEQQANVNDVLKGLGITAAFDFETADFSSISKEQLCVGNVNHGTRVIVHEDGVAAAGFTTIMMEAGAALDPRKLEPFVLDRPFIFCIERQGLPLFVGIVGEPNDPGEVVAPARKLMGG